LEVDLAPRQLDPAPQRSVFGKEVEDEPVGAVDIFGVARQRHPPERPLADAEERPDVLRHKPGDVEGALDAGQLGLRP